MPHVAHVPESLAPAGGPGWRGERRLRPVALVLFTLAVAWSFRTTFGHPDCQNLDFGAYYRGGAAVARGETPYAVDAYGPLGAYPYAPAYAYLFSALSCLDYLWAARLW